MFSVLRRRFSYANAMATLALVFAMTGGAYAASKFLITSTKQIKPSVLAQLKGKSGKNGAPGPQGPAGSAGAVGPQGQAGANGKDGAAGAAGAQGPAGPMGLKGATGATGAEGSPWTAGGTLPSGKTETGTWTVNLYKAVEEQVAFEPISFPIGLSAGGDSVYLNEEETATEAGTGGCTGSVVVPTAPAGKLCVYTEEEESSLLAGQVKTLFGGQGKYGVPGTYLEVAVKKDGYMVARGSWAVTAP